MNKSVNFLLFVFLLFNTALKFPLFHYSSREKKNYSVGQKQIIPVKKTVLSFCRSCCLQPSEPILASVKVTRKRWPRSMDHSRGGVHEPPHRPIHATNTDHPNPPRKKKEKKKNIKIEIQITGRRSIVDWSAGHMHVKYFLTREHWFNRSVELICFCITFYMRSVNQGDGGRERGARRT